VIARRGFSAPPSPPGLPPETWDALGHHLERIRRDAEVALARRWPKATVALVDRPPVEAILESAAAWQARAIVLGSRGYGPLGRLLLGSVSRGVVRGATCAVLVVKGRARPVRHLVIGFDGSAHARRAVELAAALPAPHRGRVTLVAVVEPVRVPTMPLVPAAVRASIREQAEKLTADAVEAARQDAEAAAARLRPGGWRVRALVRRGMPLDELLAAARPADCLVLGARGVGGMERLLLGSVAEGALGRSPVSVLLVR
jgi:nucleotide-binding universal stress UspA family protein